MRLELREAASGGDKDTYSHLQVIGEQLEKGHHGDPTLEGLILKNLKQAEAQSFEDSHEAIYKEGEKDQEVYFLIKGQVLLTSQKSDTQYVIEEGSFFGERELFFDRQIDGTCDTPSQDDLARGVKLDHRNRQHTAKVISAGIAEMVYLSWQELLGWHALGGEKHSLDPNVDDPVLEGEYLLEMIRAKAAERALQDDHFMIKRKRDRTGVIIRNLTRYRYENLRQQMCIPIRTWCGGINEQRALLDASPNKQHFLMANDPKASEEEKDVGQNFAAAYIQAERRSKKKNKARGASKQRPEDLREFIEMETGRLERNFDSVSNSLKSKIKDELVQVNDSMEERISEVMNHLQVQAADKKDVESITSQVDEKHKEMVQIVGTALQKPIDVLEEKMKKLDSHMTNVGKHIVQMDHNMKAVMKALDGIQASVTGTYGGGAA